MKHSFIALSIFTVTFTVILVACSKKDWLPNNQKATRPVRNILAAKSDTPYGEVNSVTGDPGFLILPAAAADTPYGVINGPIYFPASIPDTPYGK
jgi:hypothetical protein